MRQIKQQEISTIYDISQFSSLFGKHKSNELFANEFVFGHSLASIF